MSKTVYYLTVSHFSGEIDPGIDVDIEEAQVPERYECLCSSESPEVIREVFRKVCSEFLFDVRMVENARSGDDWVIWLDVDGEKCESVIVSHCRMDTDEASFAPDGSGVTVPLGATLIGDAAVLGPFSAGPFDEDIPTEFYPLVSSAEEVGA
jgi:hypothetical protein